MSEILSIIEQNNGTRVSSTSSLGQQGENLAVEFLIAKGYRIVVANFKVPVGRNSKGVSVTGEIDIVALDVDTLCFVEVKTRRSDEFVPVIAAVDLRKQRQIARTARVYRRVFNIRDIEHRYDVVTVLLPKHSKAEIELVKGFWTDAVFQRKAWNQTAWYENS
ncbi:MAG: YraN family protein [Acidobacteria bacterium]|nr:YraN family protein [Acidobacteriota bacterium]MBK9526879.1 YraN family protein [Acidobacteriota bacterium]MBP7476808.1 YraN family protein [Pyrinomonadaceae bacterium]MBP9110760.1 YraN family protein [Pyrinomonadaceae bacterium]